MSGSVTSVAVTLTPAQRARLERERTRRQRLRAAADGARAAAVGAAATVQRAEPSAGGRGRLKRHTAGPAGCVRRAAPRAAGHIQETRPPAAPRPVPTPVARRAAAVAAEAQALGLEAVATAAAAAVDEAAAADAERRLDDAIDAAATAAVVEARLAAAAQAVLGEGWTPQPGRDAVERRTARGDRARLEVTAKPDGTAVVAASVDARSATINGRPANTCADEDRITRELVLGLPSDQLERASDPWISAAAPAWDGPLAARAQDDDRAARQVDP